MSSRGFLNFLALFGAAAMPTREPPAVLCKSLPRSRESTPDWIQARGKTGAEAKRERRRARNLSNKAQGGYR